MYATVRVAESPKGWNPLGMFARVVACAQPDHFNLRRTMRKAPEAAPVKKEKQPKNNSASAQPKKRVRKSKPKILPPVKWTRIAQALSQSEVEERMNIREFVLRFNDLSESGLLKNHLEELEQINGKYNGQEGHDPTSWVSDACAKSIIMMLLGILSTDESSPWKEVSLVFIQTRCCIDVEKAE